MANTIKPTSVSFTMRQAQSSSSLIRWYVVVLAGMYCAVGVFGAVAVVALVAG